MAAFGHDCSVVAPRARVRVRVSQSPGLLYLQAGEQFLLLVGLGIGFLYGALECAILHMHLSGIVTVR